MKGLKRFIHRLTLAIAIVGYRVGEDDWVDEQYMLGPFITGRRINPIQAWQVAKKVMERGSDAQANSIR